MNEIRRVLRQAAWRLLVIDFFRVLAVTLTAAVAAVICVRLAQQIFGLEIVWPGDWMRIFAGAAAGAVLAAAVWSLIRRARGVAVARALDERANLRESLSTALCVAKSNDPWAAVVVETARQKAVGVRVRQAIPITAPRLWPVPLAGVLTLAIVWWSVPRIDVFGWFNQKQVARQEEQQRVQAVSETKEAMAKVEEALRKAKLELGEEEERNAEGEERAPLSPDEIRRQAVKKLTSMTERLEQMKNGEKAQQFEAIKEAMKQLKQPGPGPLENLAKALQQGNFQKAQEELEQLAQKMASGDMSPEDKQKAAEQMKKLAEQLEQLAQKSEALQKKLEQAGMSKEAAQKAARDPQALQQALEQMKNLSEEQKKELMEMAKAQMAACQQCQGMGQSMSQMAKGMGKSGMSQEGQQGMESLAGQLSEMEMMAQEMEAMDAAMSEAMRQLASMASQCQGGSIGDGELAYKNTTSPWRAGDSNNNGGGRGGPGRSGGSGAGEEKETGVNIAKAMSPAKLGQGPIVGSRLVQGDQIRGESYAEFQAAIETSAKAAAEAVENQQVPRELHDAVKGYFGRLEAKGKGAGSSGK